MSRRELLNALIDDRFAGSQVDFAKAIGKSPAQVNQWMTGHRNIGGASARHVEITLGLGQGYFDGRPALPSPGLAEPARPATITETVERLGELLARAAPSTRQAVADLILRYAQEPEEGARIAQAIELLLREETQGDPRL